MKYLNTIITGTGSYIPDLIKTNKDFEDSEFFTDKNETIEESGETISEKFKSITGIEERRYAANNLNTSDLATFAARMAVENSGIDPETIDQIIVTTNFGNVIIDTIQSDFLPSIASRVKHNLGIKNPKCTAYDLVFGCPGWIQGLIHAHNYIKAGAGKRFLVIGAETLSRVVDMHDRDSMIYSDGAGAAIVEAIESDEKEGLLGWESEIYTKEEAYFLFLGKSNKPGESSKIRYIKMHGRKIYEFALSKVPPAMKAVIDHANIDIKDVKKILIHQANEKMDEAMVQRLYKSYKMKVPENIMPMSIHKLGNSSVATLPTLFDKLNRNIFENHKIEKNDILVFSSVGAGMNVNTFIYKY